ncbi:TPA: TonB-dependent receptor plug domain-containing protein [Escherichia coli]
MARSKTAQPKHSLRKIAVVVATAVSGMSVYAQAAVEPKEDTITVTAAPAPQESAWGPAATIAARQSATGTKTDTPIQKVPQSISVVTAEEMALHQPKSVKEALSYTPGVSVGTRGASNTYDHLIIRGFAAEGQSQNNYLNGLKLQGNFYNDAVIDPYMLERAEIMRGPVSVLYGKSSPGGLLNMVSKRPTTEPLKEVQFKAGTDSLFQEILDEYGIPNAWQGETNFWGSTAVSIDRLAAYKDVDVLCFDHDNSKDMDALMATPLWQAMPFVRAGRFQRVPAVWFYGATLSAMHFVRVLDNAIGGKA